LTSKGIVFNDVPESSSVMDMENIFINTATKNPIDVFFSGDHE